MSQKTLIENAAYVQNGFRSGNVTVRTLGTPFPAAVSAFGKPDGESGIKISTRKGDFLAAYAALDCLRDHGWAVTPDVPQFTAKEIGYITFPKLKKKGWTDAMREAYLPTPDKVIRNPHYRTGPPMQLYAKTRVAILTKLPEVAEALSASMARRRASGN